MDGTKYGEIISNFINNKNKKGYYIDDFGLISFIKPFANEIINKYGVDALFKGINKIAEHYDAENYNPTFGNPDGGFELPKGYLNEKNRRLVFNKRKEMKNKIGKN